MNLISFYEKTTLLIDKAKKQAERSKAKDDKALALFDSLKLHILEGIRMLIRFLCLLFNDSSENFLMFASEMKGWLHSGDSDRPRTDILPLPEGEIEGVGVKFWLKLNPS